MRSIAEPTGRERGPGPSPRLGPPPRLMLRVTHTHTHTHWPLHSLPMYYTYHATRGAHLSVPLCVCVYMRGVAKPQDGVFAADRALRGAAWLGWVVSGLHTCLGTYPHPFIWSRHISGGEEACRTAVKGLRRSPKVPLFPWPLRSVPATLDATDEDRDDRGGGGKDD